jgi:hypothetical protein
VTSCYLPSSIRLFTISLTALSMISELLRPHLRMSLRQLGHSRFLKKLSFIHSWQNACPQTAVLQLTMKSMQMVHYKLSASVSYFFIRSEVVSNREGPAWVHLSENFLSRLLSSGGSTSCTFWVWVGGEVWRNNRLSSIFKFNCASIEETYFIQIPSTNI